MRWSVRRKTIAFVVLGCVGVGGAVALNIGWVIVSWREAGLLVAGLILFPLIITGVILNTIFLVREIRRNEQHENFINAVTHELKTPIASVKLHLQTLQQRQVDESKRQEFYQVMVDDCDAAPVHRARHTPYARDFRCIQHHHQIGRCDRALRLSAAHVRNQTRIGDQESERVRERCGIDDAHRLPARCEPACHGRFRARTIAIRGQSPLWVQP